LVSLRGVDVVQPDALTGFLDGVPVDYGGFAGDVGVGREGRETPSRRPARP